MVLPEFGHIIDEEFYCDECTVKCSDCGEYILKEDAIETGYGNLICEYCRDEDYYACEDCGEIYRRNDMTWIENMDTFVCDDCLDSYYKCECCEKWFSSRGVRETYDGNWVCDDCSCDYYTCADCGYLVHSDEAIYDENNDCDYCPNCEDKHPESIYNYHSFEDFECQTTSNEEDTKEYFGFELEVSGDRSYANEFAKMTPDVVLMNDSSICGGGFEIVSQPMTRGYFKEKFVPKFEKSLKFLNEKGFRGHNKGGMHIHISADALSKRQLAQMAEVLYGDENDRDIWLCLTQRHEREIDSWGSMKNRDLSFDEIANSESIMPRIAHDRYTALNCDTRTETYELRIFNSNIRIERFLKNMECAFALVDYSKQEEKNPYKCDTQGFLQFVKDHRLDYPNLYAYMLERRVEEHYGIKFTEEELEAA